LKSKVLDINARYLGVPTLLLMENAGRKIADECESFKNIVIFSGRGGNGGDGLTAARLLHSQGKKVKVYALSGRRSQECQENFDMIKALDLQVTEVYDSSQCEIIRKEVGNCDVAVDALLGVGVEGSVREPIRSLIELINHLECGKISVDVPSGDDETSVKADIVLALHNEKVSGSKIVDIGMPPEAEKYVGPGDVYLAIPRRNVDSHKGDFGRVLIVGGSKRYIGTPMIVAQACLKGGADLVTIACPKIVAERIPYDPNIIVDPLKSKNYFSEDDVEKILEGKFDVLVIGNGLGTHSDTKYVLRELLGKVETQIVLDADALRLVDKKHLKNNMVLTPHAHEFESLFGGIGEDREMACKAAAKKTETVVLLKGAVDVISNGKTTRLNKTGNPAMTVGGTGDVLAGLVAGLIAQNKNSYSSACAGAFLNGLAGDIAFEKFGVSVTATDVIGEIHSAISFSEKFY